MPDDLINSAVDSYVNEVSVDAKMNLRKAEGTNPDMEVKYQGLTKELGVPVGEHNYAEMNNLALNRRRTQALQSASSVKLEQWLADPRNSAIASDSVDSLTASEKILYAPIDMPRAFAQGAVGQGLGSVTSAFGGLVRMALRREFETQEMSEGNFNTTDLDRKFIDENTAWVQAPGKAIKQFGEDYLAPPKHRRWTGTEIAAGLGQVGVQIGAYAVGGPLLSTPMMWAQGFDQMDDMVDKDKASYNAKDTARVLGAFVTGVTESWGLSKLVDRVPSKARGIVTSKLIDLSKAALYEGSQEMSEQLGHNLLRKTLTNEEQPVFEGIVQSGEIGAWVGAITRAALGVRGVRHQLRLKEMFDDLNANMGESPLYARDKGSYTNWLNFMTRGSKAESVFVDAEHWTQYFQGQNIDPAEVAKAAGAKNYDEAVAGKSKIEFPLGDFTTNVANTPHLAGVLEDVTLSEKIPSMREARDFAKQQEDMKEQFKAEAAKVAERVSSMDERVKKMVAEIAPQLESLGFDKRAANDQAMLLRGIAVKAVEDANERAKEQGRTASVEEQLANIDRFWKLFKFNVGSGVQRSESLKAEDMVRGFVDRLRNQQIPSDRETFGATLTQFLSDMGNVNDVDFKDLYNALGVPAEQALDEAVRAGYLPEGSTVEELKKLIRRELTGNPVYSEGQKNAQLAHDMQVLQELDQLLRAQGIDVATLTTDEVVAFLKGSPEAVTYEQPFDGKEVATTPLPEGTAEIDVDGTLRPALNSDGKPIHWSVEGVRNFWRWFGDSKVVDANGRPLVVYHGTRREFDVFEPSKPRGAFGNPVGIYFDSDKNVADEYAQDNDGAIDDRSKVIAAYVRVTSEQDGVIKERVERGKNQIEVIAFSPEQVKSVENSGQFDPQNASILNQQPLSDYFKAMGIQAGATSQEMNAYLADVGLTETAPDERTGFPTWKGAYISLDAPQDVTATFDGFYSVEHKLNSNATTKAVEYQISNIKGEVVGYTVLEIDGGFPVRLLDIFINEDHRGKGYAEKTVAGLANDAGELGVWNIVDGARSWWEGIGVRPTDSQNGVISFRDYADARAEREAARNTSQAVQGENGYAPVKYFQDADHTFDYDKWESGGYGNITIDQAKELLNKQRLESNLKTPLRNEIGLYSAAEKAVIDMNLPQWKKDGGQVWGKEIWQKLSKSSGVKAEELKWLGIEEFLTGDFTPKWVKKNSDGEVVATLYTDRGIDPIAEGYEVFNPTPQKFTREEVINFIRNNGVTVEMIVADESPSEDEVGEFDWVESTDDDPANWEGRAEDFMYEFDRGQEDSFWWDWETWFRDKADEDEVRKALVLEEDEDIPDYDDLTEMQKAELYAVARDDAQEAANETAEREYNDNPYRIWRDSNTDIEIFGNDDIGYSILHNGNNINRSNRNHNGIYSFSEAEIQARDYAWGNGLFSDGGGSEGPNTAKWGEYITEGGGDNYRELKLTLPNNPGSPFYYGTHFDDDNIVTFLRVTDRGFKVSSDGNVKNTFFVEEHQSDWHQQAREKGYVGSEKIDSSAWEVREENGDFYVRIPGRSTDFRAWKAKDIEQARRLAEAEVESKMLPDAPFKDDAWVNLGLKTALLQAMKGDYEAFAWADAQVLADRWSERYLTAYTNQYDKKMPSIVKRLTGVTPVHLTLDGDPYPTIYPNEERQRRLDEIGNREEALESKVRAMPGYAEAEQNGTLSEWLKNTPAAIELRAEAQLVSDEYRKFKQEQESPPLGYWIIELSPELKGKINKESFTLFQNKGSGPRGAISFGGMNFANISLFEGADMSTFVHEMGHYYMQMIYEISVLPDATQKAKNDYQQILDVLGISHDERIRREGEYAALMQKLHAENRTATAEERAALNELVKHQEDFAKMHEAYLMEGKTPAPALKGVFARFTDWLVGIYHQLTALGVKLDDKARDIFDRIYATEAEIELAKAESNYHELNAEALGLDEKTYKWYKEVVEKESNAAKDAVRTKLMSVLVKRDEKWWKAQLEKEKRTAAKELRQRPEYVAFDRLAKVGSDEKLNKEELIAKYGPDITSKLVRGYGKGKGAVYAIDGLRLDVAADIFGYRTGDELVKALLTVEHRDTVLNRMAQQRMYERHNDLLDKAELNQESHDALESDVRADKLFVELEAIGKLARPREQALEPKKPEEPTIQKRTKEQQAARWSDAERNTLESITRAAAVMPSLSTYRSAAMETILSKRMGDIKPHLYLDAMRKHSRVAFNAMAANDYKKAREAKHAELLNHFLYRYARDAVKDRAKSERIFKTIRAGKESKLSRSRDFILVSQARVLLADHGIGRGEESRAYLQLASSTEGQDYTQYTPMNDWGRYGRDVDEMSYEDFTAFRNEVVGLWNQSREDKVLEIDGKRVEKQAVLNDLYDQLNRINKKGAPAKRTKGVSKGDHATNMLQTYVAHIRRAENWATAMDAGRKLGPFWKYIFNRVKSSADLYRDDMTRVRKEILEAVKSVDFPAELIKSDELGYTFGEDHRSNGAAMNELLGALLHTGNESNLQKLLIGKEWGSLRDDGTLDTSRWDSFINRLIAENKLRKEHFDFLQKIWDINESLKGGAQQAHRRLYGHYFSEVTAKPFSTPWGEYRGGYVPAIIDVEVVADAALRAVANAENDKMQFAFPTTGKGFTMKRAESYARALEISVNGLTRHTDKVLLFTHMQPAANDVMKIFKDRDFVEQLNHIDPAAMEGLLLPWLNRATRQIVEEPVGSMTSLARVFSVLRGRAGALAMFGNVGNALQQSTGLLTGLTDVRARSMKDALAAYLMQPGAVSDSVKEKSLYMKNRMAGEIYAMNNAIEEIVTNPSALKKAESFTMQNAYFMQSAADNIIGTIVWSAKYNEAVADGFSDEEAVQLADRTVRTTQSSNLSEDLSNAEAGTAFTRMFTQFTGWFNSNFNKLYDEYLIASRGEGVAKNKARLAYVLTVGFLIQSWVAEAIVLAVRGGPDDEDKDGSYIDDWLKGIFLWGTLKSGAAMFTKAGQAMMLVLNSLNDKVYDDRFTTPPAAQLVERAITTPVRLANRKGEVKPKEVLDAVATSVAAGTGVQISPITSRVGVVADVATGKVKNTGPADIARAVVTGRESPESRGR